MTKETLKGYLTEAVDALDQADLEALFPIGRQPDLYTLLKEVIGVRGVVNKSFHSIQQVQDQLQQLTKEIDSQQSKSNIALEQPSNKASSKSFHPDLEDLIFKLLQMDELIYRTKIRFEDLPKLKEDSNEGFSINFATWRKGYTIMNKRWENVLQSVNLIKTGYPKELFNPEFHEAIDVNYNPIIEENRIVETAQFGYTYKGQVLQVAKVIVNTSKKLNA